MRTNEREVCFRSQWSPTWACRSVSSSPSPVSTSCSLVLNGRLTFQHAWVFRGLNTCDPLRAVNVAPTVDEPSLLAAYHLPRPSNMLPRQRRTALVPLSLAALLRVATASECDASVAAEPSVAPFQCRQRHIAANTNTICVHAGRCSGAATCETLYSYAVPCSNVENLCPGTCTLCCVHLSPPC